MILATDMDLVMVTDDPDEAVASVDACIHEECPHMIGS
jgi:hypothetical protein